MRKLGLKLGLSCAALAACATTLVSTTFAWYTSNDSVKATGITGKTSAQDDTLLLISKTGVKGQWGAKVTLDTSKVTLEPVEYNATKKEYYLWDGAKNAVDTSAAAVKGGDNAQSGQVISFPLYFKSGSTQNLDVQIDTFTLTNDNAANLPTKSVLAEGTGSSANTYSMNMFRATNFVTIIGATTEVATGTPAAPTTSTRTCYMLDSLVEEGTDSFSTNSSSASNAHTYYNNVKSLTTNTTEDTSDDPIDTSKTSSEDGETDIATFAANGFTIGATGQGGATGGLDNILMMQVEIYLDGWDIACFDACRNQSFTLEMTFKAAKHTGA
jgi:hypothetical protein